MLRHAALPHAMWRHAMPCRVVPWWLPMLHARTMAIHVCPCCMPFRPCRPCRPCHAMPCHAMPHHGRLPMLMLHRLTVRTFSP